MVILGDLPSSQWSTEPMDNTSSLLSEKFGCLFQSPCSALASATHVEVFYYGSAVPCCLGLGSTRVSPRVGHHSSPLKYWTTKIEDTARSHSTVMIAYSVLQMGSTYSVVEGE